MILGAAFLSTISVRGLDKLAGWMQADGPTPMLQANIEQRISNRRILQDVLWQKFWDMPPTQEDA